MKTLTLVFNFRLQKMIDYQNACVIGVCTIWKISMILEQHVLMQLLSWKDAYHLQDR